MSHSRVTKYPSTFPRLCMDDSIRTLLPDAERILHSLNFYYRRADAMVFPQIVENDVVSGDISRKHNSIVIQQESCLGVVRKLAEEAFCYKQCHDGPHQCDPPQRLAQQIFDHVRQSPQECPYPPLSLVSMTPVLMPDGSLLTQGYQDGVFVAPSRDYPAIPDRPTREDAVAALNEFEQIYKCFPFRAEEGQKWNETASYACVLAASLSLVARPAIPTVPLFGVTSPTPGTGKSLIAQSISSSMQGHKTTAILFKDAEEFDKLLVPVLRAGDRIVSIENLTRPLSSDHLTHALSDGIYEARILGKSETVRLPNQAVWFATGNNLQLDSDLGTRRALLIQLDSGLEHPEERDFDFSPVDRGTKLHPQLVSAALTALRAYIVAGKPRQQDRGRLGSFETWDELIVGCLLWCGYADPTHTRDDIQTDNPERDEMLMILESWYGLYRQSCVTVAEIGSKSGTELWKLLAPTGIFSAKSAGRKLSRLLNRPLAGMKLVRHGRTKYQVMRLGATVEPEAPEAEDFFHIPEISSEATL